MDIVYMSCLYNLAKAQDDARFEERDDKECIVCKLSGYYSQEAIQLVPTMLVLRRYETFKMRTIRYGDSFVVTVDILDNIRGSIFVVKGYDHSK